MEVINNIHPYIQYYLLGVLVVFVFFTVITIYGRLTGRMKVSLVKHIIGYTSISLLSWCGVVLVLIVLYNNSRKVKSDEKQIH